MFCSNCDKDSNNDAKFCENCGNPLTKLSHDKTSKAKDTKPKHIFFRSVIGYFVMGGINVTALVAGIYVATMGGGNTFTFILGISMLIVSIYLSWKVYKRITWGTWGKSPNR